MLISQFGLLLALCKIPNHFLQKNWTLNCYRTALSYEEARSCLTQWRNFPNLGRSRRKWSINWWSDTRNWWRERTKNRWKNTQKAQEHVIISTADEIRILTPNWGYGISISEPSDLVKESAVNAENTNWSRNTQRKRYLEYYSDNYFKWALVKYKVERIMSEHIRMELEKIWIDR